MADTPARTVNHLSGLQDLFAGTKEDGRRSMAKAGRGALGHSAAGAVRLGLEAHLVKTFEPSNDPPFEDGGRPSTPRSNPSGRPRKPSNGSER